MAHRHEPIYITTIYIQRKTVRDEAIIDMKAGYKGYKLLQDGKTVHLWIYDSTSAIYKDYGEFWLPEHQLSDIGYLTARPDAVNTNGWEYPDHPNIVLFDFVDDAMLLFHDKTCGFVNSDVNGLIAASWS